VTLAAAGDGPDTDAHTGDDIVLAVELRSSSPAATARLGVALADLLGPGDVVALSGPLGAGKTCLVQGLAAGLGVHTRVTSPTFVLVRHHEGRLPLVHVDAYRLADAADLLALDDDVLDTAVVTCVEWGDTVRDVLPAERLEIRLGVDGSDGDAPRRIVLAAAGAGWYRRADALELAIAGWEDRDA
jgi:tRNA threonylcarbamoyladenosine biosynthesis protein TsaE